MFIYGGLKECTGGTKQRIDGTQAVKYSISFVSYKDKVDLVTYVPLKPLSNKREFI